MTGHTANAIVRFALTIQRNIQVEIERWVCAQRVVDDFKDT